MSKIGLGIKRIYASDKRFKADRRMEGQIDGRTNGRTDGRTNGHMQDPNNVYARSFIKQGCIFMKK